MKKEKEVYSVGLVHKQFQSICKVMETVVDMQSGWFMDGPIRIALTHGKQTMTLTVTPADESK